MTSVIQTEVEDTAVSDYGTMPGLGVHSTPTTTQLIQTRSRSNNTNINTQTRVSHQVETVLQAHRVGVRPRSWSLVLERGECEGEEGGEVEV